MPQGERGTPPADPLPRGLALHGRRWRPRGRARDYYVRSGALWGQYAAFGAGSENVRTCMLRVCAGELAIDPDFRQLLVDVDAGTAQPYPDLAGGQLISSDEFKIDGVSYYQLSETGYVPGGTTDIVELRPEGITRRFHVMGSLWQLARIR